MSKDLVRNAADPKQVKKAKQKEATARDIELNDIRTILRSKEGRRFMWRLMGHCGVYKTSFTGNSHTFFNEGQRNIGLFLNAEIGEASPEAMIEMIKENQGGNNV